MSTRIPSKEIPVSAAQHIARTYGYDQVVIVARRIDAEVPGGEHVTTYGVDAQHCQVAAEIGDFLKYKVMGWAQQQAQSVAAPVVTDEQIQAWADRHYVERGVATNDLRCAFEDAASLYLTFDE